MMLYIKIGLVVALIALGIWFRGVVAERDSLKVSKELAEAQTKMYADAWNKNALLQESIQNAVTKIDEESAEYIAQVETNPAPAVPDGTRMVLIPPGLPKAPGMPQFTTYTSNRTSTNTPSR